MMTHATVSFGPARLGLRCLAGRDDPNKAATRLVRQAAPRCTPPVFRLVTPLSPCPAGWASSHECGSKPGCTARQRNAHADRARSCATRPSTGRGTIVRQDRGGVRGRSGPRARGSVAVRGTPALHKSTCPDDSAGSLRNTCVSWSSPVERPPAWTPSGPGNLLPSPRPPAKHSCPPSAD
jgi:hypothetical protein